ncbi:MAG: hypothetical protein WAX69_01475 [Victivallales bacterium]
MIFVFFCGCLISSGQNVPSAIDSKSTSSDYEFTLNGKPIKLSPENWFSLNGNDAPQPGDVIAVGQLYLTLGKEKVCNFVTAPNDEGCLLLKLEDGSTRVIGATIKEIYSEDKYLQVLSALDNGKKKEMVNPLAKMSTDEIHGLWGLHIDRYPVGLEQKIKQINLARTCICITQDAIRGRDYKSPEEQERKIEYIQLPEDLQYLVVYQYTSACLDDWKSFSYLKKLRFFKKENMSNTIDTQVFSGMDDLRYLDLRGQLSELIGIKNFPGCKNLRVLALSWCGDLSGISNLHEMKELRRLQIENTAVRDLSGLADLKNLETIDANHSRVATLPDANLPSLKNLNVMSTRLTDQAVATFKSKNPQCSVHHRYIDYFQNGVSKVTSIRCGIPHNSWGSPVEKPVFELSSPSEIKEFIDSIKIDEKRSGGRWMSGYWPVFEFYEGTEMTSCGAINQGTYFRWSKWPGDGFLTEESAEYLLKLLEKHEIGGKNREDRERLRKEREVTERRMERYRKILPESLRKDFNEAGSEIEMREAFDKQFPDKTKKAITCLRIYGCHNGGWDSDSPLDGLARGELYDLKDVLPGTFRKLDDDEWAIMGATRLIFDSNGWSDLDKETQALVLPKLAQAGLGHPRPLNRKRTMSALESIKGEQVIQILRDCLAGKIPQREFSKGESDDLEYGLKCSKREDDEVGDNCSNNAYAALILARLGDKESLPAIKVLADKAKGEDKKVLDKAIQILSMEKKYDGAKQNGN